MGGKSGWFPKGVNPSVLLSKTRAMKRLPSTAQVETVVTDESSSDDESPMPSPKRNKVVPDAGDSDESSDEEEKTQRVYPKGRGKSLPSQPPPSIPDSSDDSDSGSMTSDDEQGETPWEANFTSRPKKDGATDPDTASITYHEALSFAVSRPPPKMASHRVSPVTRRFFQDHQEQPNQQDGPGKQGQTVRTLVRPHSRIERLMIQNHIGMLVQDLIQSLQTGGNFHGHLVKEHLRGVMANMSLPGDVILGYFLGSKASSQTGITKLALDWAIKVLKKEPGCVHPSHSHLIENWTKHMVTLATACICLSTTAHSSLFTNDLLVTVVGYFNTDNKLHVKQTLGGDGDDEVASKYEYIIKLLELLLVGLDNGLVMKVARQTLLAPGRLDTTQREGVQRHFTHMYTQRCIAAAKITENDGSGDTSGKPRRLSTTERKRILDEAAAQMREDPGKCMTEMGFNMKEVTNVWVNGNRQFVTRGEFEQFEKHAPRLASEVIKPCVSRYKDALTERRKRKADPSKNQKATQAGLSSIPRPFFYQGYLLYCFEVACKQENNMLPVWIQEFAVSIMHEVYSGLCRRGMFDKAGNAVIGMPLPRALCPKKNNSPRTGQ